MPIFEFVCNNPKCEDVSKVVDKLVVPDEKVYCVTCSAQMDKLLSATWGRVRGTENPVYMSKRNR